MSNPIPSPAADERAGFEAWAFTKTWRNFTRDGSAYSNSQLNALWVGWQARAALAAPSGAATDVMRQALEALERMAWTAECVKRQADNSGKTPYTDWPSACADLKHVRSEADAAIASLRAALAQSAPVEPAREQNSQKADLTASVPSGTVQAALPAREQLYDDEGVTLESNKPFSFTCCDCGLTHHMVIVSEDGKPVGFAVKRVPSEQPKNDRAALWKHRYYELRHTMQDWHAQAVAAGFDGVSVVLMVSAESVKLFDALNAMLTHFGMDEDEWNRPTFKQAKEAIAQYTAARAATSARLPLPGALEPNEKEPAPSVVSPHQQQDEKAPADGGLPQFIAAQRSTFAQQFQDKGSKNG